MTKQQQEWIEYRLTTLYRKSDRLEERADKAKAEGDMERYARLDHRDDCVVAEISAIQDVLHCLGYYARLNDDDTAFIVHKREY